MKAQYITATEVAEIMGISRSKSYQIVRQLNKELKAQGYLTSSFRSGFSACADLDGLSLRTRVRSQHQHGGERADQVPECQVRQATGRILDPI